MSPFRDLPVLQSAMEGGDGKAPRLVAADDQSAAIRLKDIVTRVPALET